MARPHPAFFSLLALLACTGMQDGDDGDVADGPRCDADAATGPTGTSQRGGMAYQVGDIVDDVDLVDADGHTVSIYDMCGRTVMLVHGELG
ncbi:MAG: hypothetical protein D6798_04965 [Deltaproteobacteria bacterium]|nr:MAG: hypothetical protein D6798_04965 [Deltaproteobacteria bacterium]